MIRLAMLGDKQEWLWVAPRSVATVLETVVSIGKAHNEHGAATAIENVLVAVLAMWDGSKHTVLDPERKVAAMIQEGQEQARRLPPMVTKRKPIV